MRVSLFFRVCLPAVFWASPVWLAGFAMATPAPADLRVSENRRYLEESDGKPFFYLGDTAWELFHRLNREEAAWYFQRRAAQGFTVVQAVALAEMDGVRTPNAQGDLPFLGEDPTRPAVKDGPDNDYWDHADALIRMANEAGLVVGLLPTWGDKWKEGGGAGPRIFNPENAGIYAKWLASRYKNAAVIWILGGDRMPEKDGEREIIRAMAAGLRDGDGGRHLITWHPGGGHGSSEDWHSDFWLDFNMRQNGHNAEFESYQKTLTDYQRTDPVKPVLDGEPIYEDHPVSFNAGKFGHSVAADVRRAFYWDLFLGACGHTYGHHSVWQCFDTGRPPVNSPLMTWREALEQPGARQMAIGRKLMQSRPWFQSVPDPAMIIPEEPPSAVPGAGIRRMTATRDAAGHWAMVYCPVPRPFKINPSTLKASELQVWWFNPRTGVSSNAGRVENKKEIQFFPPDAGEFLDWVLVLDNPGANLPPPG